jgi:hypothetical protein
MTTSPHFLRRRDDRYRVNCRAHLECRSISQTVEIVDFSMQGLRVDGATGLAPGDKVSIALSPVLKIEGVVVWSVWHKAGVKLPAALRDGEPAFIYLANQAAKLREQDSE